MTLNKSDWFKLRFPIICLGAVVIAIAFLLAFTEQQKEVVTQALQSQITQLNQAKQRYSTSDQEKETIAKYLPQYQALIRNGFIGEERRIEWVDALRRIHQEQKLFNINYSIGAQEEYKPTFASNIGGFKFYRSVMKLELSMLHEGDLIALIQSLANQQSTPFMLRQCEIIRQNTKISNVLIPNMRANCELDWLTIHEPATTGVATP